MALLLILYYIIGLILAVAFIRYEEQNGELDGDREMGQYIAYGFMVLLGAAIWPLLLVMAGIGRLVSWLVDWIWA